MSTRRPLPIYDAPEPVMRVAGAWLARRDRGFTSAEEDEFESWVRANPHHAAAVAQLERTMSAFDRLRELAPGEGLTPDCDALAPSRTRRRWMPVGLAGIAAAVALVFWSNEPRPTDETRRYVTPVGGYDRATLADGSTVDLNSDTVVEVRYRANQRQVQLTRGEAHFQVAKDPSRPFVVQANAVSVRAVGTAFNVRFASAGVEVLVTQGQVRVDPPAKPTPADSSAPRPRAPAELPLLTAGHKVTVPTLVRSEPARIATVTREEMQRALSWQRVAEFNKTPLGAAVAEFNRQNQAQIEIRDAELESLRIGGSFRTDQPDAFVRLLETSFGVRAERSTGRITLRKAQPESP